MNSLINGLRIKAQEILGNYQISNYLNYLRKAQYFDKEKILHNQALKFKKLINYTSKNIKYYKDFFSQHDLTFSDIKTPNDLIKLPIMTKELYRENFPHNLVDKTVPKCNYVLTHTSGSTAAPINIFTPHILRGLYAAESIFFFEWAGKQYGEPYVRIWGDEGKSIWLFNTIIKNALVVNSIDLGDDSIHKLYKRIKNKKIKFLEAFTSSAYAFALLLNKYNLELNFSSSLVSGESLFDFQRDMIREQFNTKIFNRYGCRECGDIAQECSKHEGLHILQENFLIEILDKNNNPVEKGEKGKIIITHLDNYLSPLIRYQIDDIGALSPTDCSCGRKWQTLEFIEGRISDVIYSPSGRHLSLFFFIHLFEKMGYNTVQEYQVVQRKNAPKLLLKIIPGQKYNKMIGLKIINEIKKIDNAFQISIEIVDKIALESSGKKKLIKILI